MTVAPDADMQAAVDRLQTNNIKKLPVVEDGSLVGIVTTTDLSDYIPHLSRAVRRSNDQSQQKRFTRPDTLYENEDWTFESYGTADGIDVGDHVEFSKTISKADVEAFAEASGDTNRLHLRRDVRRRNAVRPPDCPRNARVRLHQRGSGATPRTDDLSLARTELQGPVDIDEEVTAAVRSSNDSDNRFRWREADVRARPTYRGDPLSSLTRFRTRPEPIVRHNPSHSTMTSPGELPPR